LPGEKGLEEANRLLRVRELVKAFDRVEYLLLWQNLERQAIYY
jgi:hypothetical protein